MELVASRGEAGIEQIGVVGAGEGDDRSGKSFPSHLPDHLNSIHDGHLYVGYDQIESEAGGTSEADEFDGLGAVVGGGDLAADGTEGDAESAAG